MTDPYARPEWQPVRQVPHSQGQPPWQPSQPAPWQPASYPPMAGGAGGYGTPPQRPGTVLAGAIMTYIGGGLLVVASLIVLLGVAADGDQFAAAFTQGTGFDADPGTVQASAIGAGIGILVQGVLLIVAAAFAQHGSNGWRIALTVIGGLNALFNLAQLATGAVIGLLALAYIAVAVTLFWVGEANAWYRMRKAGF